MYLKSGWNAEIESWADDALTQTRTPVDIPSGWQDFRGCAVADYDQDGDLDIVCAAHTRGTEGTVRLGLWINKAVSLVNLNTAFYLTATIYK